MLHVIGFLALLALVLIFQVGNWLLKALGIIKPPAIVPSGVAIGERATRTIVRDTPSAERHMDALSRMTVITDVHNGEQWRVESFEAVIDNRYRFIIRRVG